MHSAKRTSYLFLYSSALLTIASMVKAYESAVWAQVNVTYTQLLPFIGSSTFTAYIGYWHISHVYVQSPVTLLRLQRTLLIVGAGLCCITILPLTDYYGPILLLCLLGGIYASPLVSSNVVIKKILYFKAALLAMIWTIATVIIPLWHQNTSVFGWILLTRFSLVFALCMLFDLRDLERDKKQNRLHFLHALSSLQIILVYYATIMLYFIGLFFLQQKGSSDIPYWLGVVPGILAASVFPAAQHTRNPYFYYGLIDSLMMLSGLLLLFLRFK